MSSKTNNHSDGQINSNSIKLLRYAKTSLNVSQSDIANVFGTSRASVSRVENGSRGLTLREYISLCDFIKIDVKSISDGFINLEDENSVRAFRIQRPWNTERYSYGNIIRVYYKYFISNYSEKGFNDFCHHVGIDPIYFFNVRNSINIDFILRMAQALVLKGDLKNTEQFVKLANFLSLNPESKRHQLPEEEHHPQSVLDRLPAIMKSYEKNHDYRIDDISNKKDSFTLSFRPREHVNHKLWLEDSILGGFVNSYIKHAIPVMLGYKDYKIHTLEDYKKRSSQWTRVKVEA